MGGKQSKVAYFDGSYYLGEVNAQGHQHGKGQIFYANGDKLQGTFVDSDCTYASLTKKNGDYYQGQMRDLRFHGQGKLKSKGEDYQGLFRAGTFLHGKLTSHDGTIFSGSFEDACKSGEGELRTADGTVYKGYFRRDKFDGKGQLQHTDGSKYVGQFKAGLFDGHGELVKMERGRKSYHYVGSFVNGVFDGQGKVSYEGGNSYQGGFKGGKKDGKGIFRYQNGDVYEGCFRQDVKQDTKCTITRTNGTKYEGGISNDQYHGRGRLQKANGEYYDGEFQKGFKHGRGKLKNDQFLYDGEFLSDLKHGDARVNYFNDQHKVFTGRFQNGQMHGLCVERSDRQVLHVTYNQGIKEGPYKKKLGQDYEEEGTFANDQRHGIIKIRKGDETGSYLYEEGNRIKEVKA